MCYKVSTPTLRQLDQYLKGAPGLTIDDTVEPYFFADGFDYPRLPVALQGHPHKIITMRWGLLPKWFDLVAARETSVKDQIKKLEEKSHKTVDPSVILPKSDEALISAFTANTLNAKAEEVFNKPSWRMSIMGRRCIIYTTGFYEWRHYDNGKVKIPYYIYGKDEPILRMGGIWSSWTHPDTAEVTHSFAIITVPANQLMAKIHNSKLRMPFLLSKEEADIWLSKETSEDQVRKLMQSCPDEYLSSHTVSTLISKRVPAHEKNIEAAQVVELYPDWVKD